VPDKNLEVWFAACRENTGAHFLDSGSAYGRYHEQPPIDANEESIKLDPLDGTPSIETGHWLANTLDTQTDGALALNAEFGRLAEGMSDATWVEVLEALFGRHGWDVESNRYNVYDSDNDFTQGFVFTFCQQEAQADYPEFVAIEVHTGCDVRGGYAKPLFGELNAEFGYFFEWQVRFDAIPQVPRSQPPIPGLPRTDVCAHVGGNSFESVWDFEGTWDAEDRVWRCEHGTPLAPSNSGAYGI